MNRPATPVLKPPTIRGLNEAQAAAYVGLGVTLFREIGPPPIRVRHRNIWDRLDLDTPGLTTINVEGGPGRKIYGPRKRTLSA